MAFSDIKSSHYTRRREEQLGRGAIHQDRPSDVEARVVLSPLNEISSRVTGHHFEYLSCVTVRQKRYVFR